MSASCQCNMMSVQGAGHRLGAIKILSVDFHETEFIRWGDSLNLSQSCLIFMLTAVSVHAVSASDWTMACMQKEPEPSPHIVKLNRNGLRRKYLAT